MTNPFTRLKQLRAAEAVMRDFGFEGETIVELCHAAIDLVSKQNDTILQSNKLMEQASAEPQGEVTVKYLIPYRVRHTQHPNGGRQEVADGMTMVDMGGGIANWQQIQGVVHYLKSTPEIKKYNNPEVIITGLFPVDSWVKEQVAEVVSGEK